MQLKAVHTLLLGIVSWNILIVQTRVVDDRIVFPNDNDESTNIFDYSPIVNDNRTAACNITIADKPDNTTIADNSTTVDKLPLVISNVTTTELPTVVNRILVDTLAKCRAGQKLHAGRCRNSA